MLVQTAFLPFAKSMTEKKQRRVDCAEDPKKTVQALRYEGRGFFGAGDIFARILATLGIAQTSLVLYSFAQELALHSLAQYLPCGAARNYLSGEA